MQKNRQHTESFLLLKLPKNKAMLMQADLNLKKGT